MTNPSNPTTCVATDLSLWKSQDGVYVLRADGDLSEEAFEHMKAYITHLRMPLSSEVRRVGDELDEVAGKLREMLADVDSRRRAVAMEDGQ